MDIAFLGKKLKVCSWPQIKVALVGAQANGAVDAIRGEINTTL
jgi:hypothetical protein